MTVITSTMRRDNQLAGWTALFAAMMMLAALALSISVTGSDNNLMLDPARALALPEAKIKSFRLFLLADSFGYYLPFLIIGAHLWRRLRDAGGVAIDAGALCLLAYVLLGVAGTSIQFAVIPQLVAAHATGDAGVRAASEAAWLATVWGTQKGLWLMEGPTMAFWGVATGLSMRAQGMKYGPILAAVGALYGLLFVLFCLGADAIGEMIVMAGVLLALVWAALTGIALLREGAP